MGIPDNILDPEISNISLSRLNLEEEIYRQFVDNGYTTLGDIYSLQTEGLSLVLKIEYEKAQALWTRALEVISNPDEWVSPPPVSATAGPRKINLSQQLPSWLKNYFLESDRTRDYTILYRRYGLDGKKPATLDDVGVFLDITRERVRQLQERAQRNLHNFIFLNQQDNFSDIRLEIVGLKQSIEAEGSPVKREIELFQLITSRYGLALTSSLEQHYRLLFSVFGWEDAMSKPNSVYNPEPFWILPGEKLTKDRIFEAGKRITELLQEHCIRVEYFEIKVSLNAKRQNRFTDSEIRTAIKICQDIEQFEDDTFQMTFQRLRSAPDMAYRVLSEAGTPLSSAAIYREVSRRLALSGENILSRYTISNSMVNDSRFASIGKSEWALTDWDDVVLGTIVHHMQQFFYQNNRPAKEKEIYDFVKERRKVSRKSIAAYLADRDEFVRVSKGLYQLTEWGISKSFIDNVNDDRWTKEKLAQRIIEIFDNAKKDTMPASELIQLLGEIGINTNVYTRLRSCPAVNLTVVLERPRRLTATVIRDYSIEKAITLRERLEESVREILAKQPDNSMPLSDLKTQMIKRVNVNPYTFYGYLSDMIDIQKNVVSGTNMVIVTLVSDDLEDKLTSIPDVWDNEFTYDIAISYAGAQRDYAAQFAEEFRTKGLRVFYDRNQLPDLVGRNLLDELMIIYRDKAQLCLILASNEYNASPFAQHERQSAQERALSDKGYIVLVNLDGCKINGFHSTVAYLDWKEYGLMKIVSLAGEQLQKRNK